MQNTLKLTEKYVLQSIKVLAIKDNWNELYQLFENFIYQHTSASNKETLELILTIEEIFVNICSYAYPKKRNGYAILKMIYLIEKNLVVVSFEDNGIEFDPTLKGKPDLNLPYSKRKIGGLGIYMVNNLVKDIIYKYKNNKNILIIKKNITIKEV